jgi:hypothetical protein
MFRRTRSLLASLAGLLALSGGFVVWSGPARRHASPAGSHTTDLRLAPTDTRYVASLKRGLAGDYAGAERDFVTLANSAPGSNLAAWSIYQASLAAKARGDASTAGRLQERLARAHAGHPLTLRVQVESTPAPRPSAKSDCGPRSLLYLCRQAGIPATLPEITRLCGTTPQGTTVESLVRAAHKKGLRATAAQVDQWFLTRHRPSGVAWVDGNHYVVFQPRPRSREFWVMDPNRGAREQITAAELTQRCQGIVVLAAWGRMSLPFLAPERETGGGKTSTPVRAPNTNEG